MKELSIFIEEMRATSSALDKVAIIKRSSAFIHKVLEYTYNPYKQYNVTSKTCIKNGSLIKDDYFGGSMELFDVLDDLITRKVTGHDAIKLVNGFNWYIGGDIYKIIDKDLGIRAGAKVINKGSA